MSQLSQRNLPETATPAAVARPLAELARIQPHAADADIGTHEIVVCVPGPDNTPIVRAFGPYAADLKSLAIWLAAHTITTICELRNFSFLLILLHD